MAKLALAEAGTGEVPVQPGTSGACHEDYRLVAGHRDTAGPSVLGHEGAREVLATVGAARPSVGFNRLDFHRAKGIDLGRLVTDRVRLAGGNIALDPMRAGWAVRTVIEFP